MVHPSPPLANPQDRADRTPPARYWLGVLTLGGIVAWCGLYNNQPSAQAALLGAARAQCSLPADDRAAWAAFQAHVQAEDNGRLAPLHYYLAPLAPPTAPEGSAA